MQAIYNFFKRLKNVYRVSVLVFVYIIFSNSAATAQRIANFEIGSEGLRWVDSVFKTLTPERKIGQLFMLAEFSDPVQTLREENECLIREYGLGGLCLFKGTPMRQALLCNELQRVSEVPMLISMDAEWGLGMRLDSTLSYPKQMAMGCVLNDSLIYHYGADMARQCKRLGVHLCFGPVLDINNNPNNPVINDRSFGEDKTIVANRGVAYLKGLEDHHVMACVKHFPGHGNTESDSHLDLPIIRSSKSELDSLELYPFREAFKNNVSSLMSAHLYIPAIDTTTHIATSISPKAITKLLQGELNYQGLVFTDALNMKGVAKYFRPDSLNLKALLAGNDVLLYAEDIPNSIKYILDAVWKGQIEISELDRKVRRILAAKYWVGLNHYTPTDTANLVNDLNKPESFILRNKIAEKALVMVKNTNNLLPINKSKRTLLLNIGYDTATTFEKTVLLYYPCTIINIDKNKPAAYFDSIYDCCLDDYDLIIASLHSTSRFISRKYGLTHQAISFINKLPHKRTLYIHFGNIYALDSFADFNNVLAAHEDWEYYQKAAALLVAGVHGSYGRLSVTASARYPFQAGEYLAIKDKLSFASPEEVNIDSEKLKRVDSICKEAIAQMATPGCQVLAAKDGKVIYYKGFGTHSYTDTTSVKITDIYDIASVTKIMATTLAIMKLYDEGKIDLDKKLSYYIKELRKTNKKNIVIRDVLVHQAGLQEWIPFYKSTLQPYGLDSNIYKRYKNDGYSIEVADSVWMHKSYIDTVWKAIMLSPVKERGNYAYSDIGFILLKKLVEQISGDNLDEYLADKFYTPMQLASLTWKPRNTMPLSRIIPTEIDTVYRKQEVQGFVHDPAAAMFGGISGHAGLFSNAFDVAQVMQMLLNKGSYNGLQLISPLTVEKFMAKQPDSRRGLGFDKPETDISKASPCCVSASPLTFGHQGFTGTCTWADPKTGIVYVFLSNRINPTADNKKLGQMNVRTDIQEFIYQALIK